jgi:hypothetical protein
MRARSRGVNFLRTMARFSFYDARKLPTPATIARIETNPYRRIPIAERLGPSFQSTNCNPNTDYGVERILARLHFPGARVQLQSRQSRRHVRDLAFEQRRSHSIADTKGYAAPAGLPKANNSEPSRFCTAVALKRPQVPLVPGEDKPQSLTRYNFSPSLTPAQTQPQSPALL